MTKEKNNMTQEEVIQVPKWFLENVEDTLRIQNNINLDKGTGETCQDRNVRESLNGLRKLLSGEELTGRERLEKLHPELPISEPQGLDEAAEEQAESFGYMSDDYEFDENVESFKAGAEWMARQGETFNGFMSARGKRRSLIAIEGSSQNFKFGENVIVQIRKKEE